MNRATDQQRKTADEIWAALDALCLEVPVSDVDFYAVWGLCTAILNVPNRGEWQYEAWTSKLFEIWSEVTTKYGK
jgi:hypothetical protein